MVKLLSALFFGAGAFVVLAAFVPRLRPNWARTRIPCGFLGCLGCGSAFMSVGVNHFFSLPSRYHDWLVWLFFLGLAVGFLGMALDKRRAKRADMMQGLQTHLIAKRGDHHA
jgi:hypothetical protein